MKKRFVEKLPLLLLIIVSLVFAYYYGTQKGKTNSLTLPQITAELEQSKLVSSPVPSLTTVPTSNIPSGWKTYTNQQYSFEISYPSSYKALTDKENLYGWPNAVVLIYGGGQSYDLVIEHWNTPSEYENKYKNQTNLTVKKVGNFYLTLLNTNFETEVDEIIKTFKSF